MIRLMYVRRRYSIKELVLEGVVGLVGCAARLPVEAVVLNDEQDVVEHDDDAEGKFDVVDVHVHSEKLLEGELQEGAGAAREVHEDVEDGPSLGRLALIVPVELGQIFQVGYGQLEIAHHVEHSESLSDVQSLSELRDGGRTMVRVE